MISLYARVIVFKKIFRAQCLGDTLTERLQAFGGRLIQTERSAPQVDGTGQIFANGLYRLPSGWRGSR